jgi:dephospho-CoA kinase
VLSSDEVVHRLYAREDVRRAVAARFGAAVVAGGRVDRAAIAARVFADPDERRWLEGLLLPLLAGEFARWRDAERAAGARLLVHEAPTLFEAGIADRYDAVVTVTAPREVRLARRPGAAERMGHQLPEDEKVARSDFSFSNEGSLEDLDAFVRSVVAAVAP